VRPAINVFFPQEGTPYNRLIVDRDFSITSTSIGPYASTTDCSEFPGGQTNLAQPQRVAMTNEYLEYRFSEILATQQGQPSTFDRINGAGIVINTGQASILTGNTFQYCDYGVYAVGRDPMGDGIVVGTATATGTERNFLQRNGVGIYAGGVANIIIRANDFLENNVGVNISGETGFIIRGNNYSEHIVAENYENTGNINENSSLCNTYIDAGYGLRFLGDNQSIRIDGNDFQLVGTNNFTRQDISLRHANNRGQIILGGLKTQGSPQDGAENDFSGPNTGCLNVSTDIATEREPNTGNFLTDDFLYYSRLATHTVFNPRCASNEPCTNEVYNFSHFRVDSPLQETDPCSSSGGLTGGECVTKECLEKYYENMADLDHKWDGDQTVQLSNLIHNYPNSYQSRNMLLAQSPLLSDELLMALLENTQMSVASKATVLYANVPLSKELLVVAAQRLSNSTWTELLRRQKETPIGERVQQQLEVLEAEQSKNQALLATAHHLFEKNEPQEAFTLLANDGSKLAQRASIALRLRTYHPSLTVLTPLKYFLL